MALHVGALFTHDAKGNMLRVNEPNGRGGIAPRLFLGYTKDGVLLRFRSDVDEGRRRALAAAVDALRLHDQSLTTPIITDTLHSILERHTPVEKIERGPAFLCPSAMSPMEATVLITSENARCLEPLFPDWLGDVEYCQPMAGLVRDGAAVSLCASVRITDYAHEAGVDTARSERGRGY